MFRRANAENHFLIIIVTFALTVLVIRAYLYLTGYPQISGGPFHLAHMLWGGIALFVGSTLLLLYRGLYLSRIAAVLTGVGWGLFIDEIGKFITSSNDYFFTPAAVIIYIIFLVIVAIYLAWFRPRSNEKDVKDNEALSDALELLDGVVAGNLTHRERQLLDLRLQRLISDDEKKYQDIGVALKAYVDRQPVTIRQRRVEKYSALISQMVMRIVRTRYFFMLLLALIAIDIAISVTTISSYLIGETTFSSLAGDDKVRLVSLVMRLLGQAILIGGLFVILKRDIVVGRRLMIGSLLFLIVILDSVDFYFSQFSTAYTVALDVLLLTMVEARFGNERLHPEQAPSISE